MSDLESWCKANKLSKIFPKFQENDCDELDDLRDLETKEDAESFAKDMGLNTMLTKKFLRAIVKLNNITSAPPPSAPTDDAKESKKEDSDSASSHETKEQTPPKPTRTPLNIVGVHAVDKLKKLEIGKRHRTIMVIGATGTGKTTLLNSMMNYLWEVEFSDPYRFKVIYEDDIIKKKGNTQAMSVTDDVTAYHLSPPVLDYQLTIIDTPGFGDTRGLEQDQKITKKIKKFFETKIQEIDAICFVIRAPQARLTATQKYIFAQVLGIFGKDIAENILILMTFADGKKPPALAALKAGNVPYHEAFKLNNSAFDLPEEGEEVDMFSKMFWKLGMDSFGKLFAAIDTLKPKSLQLTRKVLSRREELENYITSVQPTIRAGFTVLDKLRSQIDMVQRFSSLINENKDFEYVEEVQDARQVSNGGAFNTTTCLNCNFTCHKNCAYSDNADKQGCCAISGEHCTCCPDKCHWTIHKNMPYTVEWFTKKVTRQSKALKDKYYDATNKKSASEQIMSGSLADFDQCQADLNGLICSVKDCLNELSKIALRPNVLSQDDYIDKLIQSEEAQRNPGYKKRIAALNSLKEKQEILSQVNQEGYNPWEKYDDVQKFMKKNTHIYVNGGNNGGARRNSKKQKKKGWFTGWF